MTNGLGATFRNIIAKIPTIHPGLALPVIGVGALLATTAILVLTEPDKPRPVDQKITDTGPAPEGRGGAPPDTAGVGVAPPAFVASNAGGTADQTGSAGGFGGGSSGGGLSARRAPTTGTVGAPASRAANTAPVSRPGEFNPSRVAPAPAPQPFVAYGREPAPMPQPSLPYRGEPAPMAQPFVSYGGEPRFTPVSAPAPEVRPEIVAGAIIGGLLGTILGVPMNGHAPNHVAGGRGAPVFTGGHGGSGHR